MLEILLGEAYSSYFQAEKVGINLQESLLSCLRS